MKSFPLVIDISKRQFLVVGGGRTAKRKIGTLRKFDAAVRVVAAETDLADEEGLTVVKKTFEEADLAGADFVIAATGSKESDAKIAAVCKAHGIPVNAAGDATAGDFHLPATVKDGPLVVAVSTSGTSPAYARRLRQDIENALPPQIGQILERLGTYREQMQHRISSQASRQAAYEEILGWMLMDGENLDDEVIEHIIARYAEEGKAE